MIGFYDYTVILTYLSILSGTTGIILCLNGVGHPYLGMFFLLFSGLCDTFDGKVARSKKDRTEQMKKFGIQIDSLSDLIALVYCRLHRDRNDKTWFRGYNAAELPFCQCRKRNNCLSGHFYYDCNLLCTGCNDPFSIL